ncbi:MAG: hypothetical protein E6I89_16905 [Chloroflexi bacterium]|nr:MAG: hypothetical protein E6I89_16905 [Chloroflexota bacterium]
MADQPLKRIASAGGSLLGAAGVAQAMAAEEALRHEGAAEDLVVAEVAEPSEIGFWKLAVIRFLHHRTATVSMGILLFIILTAMIMPTFQGDLYRLQDYTHPYGSPFEFHSRPAEDSFRDDGAAHELRRLHHHRRDPRSPGGFLRRLDRQRLDAIDRRDHRHAVHPGRSRRHGGLRWRQPDGVGSRHRRTRLV